MREVVGPHGDHLGARVQVDQHVHLAVAARSTSARGSVRAAGLAHLHAVDRDVELVGVERRDALRDGPDLRELALLLRTSFSYVFWRFS